MTVELYCMALLQYDMTSTDLIPVPSYPMESNLTTELL